MAKGICNNHGQVEAEWKSVFSKAKNKTFQFWSCPRNEKDQYGNWIKCRVDVKENADSNFDKSLSSAASHNDQSAKDDLITRTAIAKSLIERGDKWSMDTAKEAEAWVAWCKGKNTLTAALNAPQAAVQPQVTSDEVSLEDLPF